MHLEEDDVNNLKSWVVVRLKDISDADSDVLADYILALIRTDIPQPKLRLDVSENLEDFLKDSKKYRIPLRMLLDLQRRIQLRISVSIV